MSGLIPKPQRSHQLPDSGILDSEGSPEKLSEKPWSESFSSEVTTPAFYKASQPQADQERVVVLVDGSNLFYAASILNIGIDYAKLLQVLVRGRRLVRAYFYTGVDRSNEKQQGFLLWMSRNGYRVISKELIQFPDGSRKANLDVEMAIDMLLLARCCDTIVLLSGDGDLAYAVNSVTYKGIRVEVVSLQSMTSDSLINVSDLYIDLGTIKDQVQRSDDHREQPSTWLHRANS
jgi:uncharacterized LabA/DUF88 family protein